MKPSLEPPSTVSVRFGFTSNNGCWNAGKLFALPQINFTAAKQYLLGMHPQYGFVFGLEEKALKYWGYGPEQAKALQSDMVAVACAHAKKLDAAKGIHIVIRDETCKAPETVANITRFALS